ncbi:MAG TPA: protein translocase subunit SecD, partial [Candidatus Paceibacterota bacterium]
MKSRITALIILLVAVAIGYFVYSSEMNDGRFKFKLGLDLAGGTLLTYRADTSKIASEDISSSMQSLRDVIERRVNAFGVSEPLVQVEETGALGGNEHKLIVELPGVSDLQQAINLIGKT